MTTEVPTAGVWSAIRMPVIVGGGIIGGFLLAAIVWASLAPLSGAAIAPGVVSPDGQRRTVQHLEGGIIRALLVQNGDVVTVGQPLVALEETQALAEYEQILGRRRTFAAMEARLVAEQRGAEEIEFPDWLTDDEDNPAVAEILETQSTLFQTRQNSRSSQVSILRQRIGQLQEEINGLDAQTTSQRRQLELIESEVEDVQQLVDRGLERRTRLLTLQRAEAEIRGNLGANLAAIARAQQTVGETDLQILNLDADRLDQIAEELNQVRFELSSVEQELRRTQDVLSRTTIVAPISGTIVDSRFRTTGGVIRPGEPILDIVPDEEELLIDARVSPIDIDSVEPGMMAQVVLSAFSQRRLPRIEGRVRGISADRLIDETTGQAYFLARVEVDPAQLEGLPGHIRLSPGMPAEVFIITEERTALEYILEPFLATFRRAFREA